MKKNILLSVLLFFPTLFLLPDSAIPLPVPGIFSGPVYLEFQVPQDGELSYYFAESNNTEPSRYTHPLLLTAMPGEKRVYDIHTVLNRAGTAEDDLHSFQYIIDQREMPRITPDPLPGFFHQDFTLSFNISRDDFVGALFYRIDGRYAEQWRGEPILLSQESKNREIHISAWLEHEGGAASKPVEWMYHLSAKPPVPDKIEVHSPVEGTFFNHQLLSIDSEGFQWIRFTIDGSDPVLKGTAYVEPILFRASGDYDLRIAARPPGTSKVMEKRILFSIRDENTRLAVPVSGVYAEDLRISLPEQGISYWLSDEVTESASLDYTGPFTIPAPPDGIFHTVVRFKNGNGGYYRYFYILDVRKPSVPVISVLEENPYRIALTAEKNAEIFYTTDGSTPDKYSRPYTGPFNLSPGESLTSGSHSVQAISYYLNGLNSEIASILLPFNIEAPSQPFVRVSGDPKQGYSISVLNMLPGTRPRYEIRYDGTIPPQPGKNSFIGEPEMELRFPAGYEGTFAIRFAAEDRFGNISSPTEVVARSVNRRSPEPPKIIFAEGILKLEGSGTIRYEISEDGQTFPSVTVDSPVYEEPIDFKKLPGTMPGIMPETMPETRKIIRVSAVAVDEDGNRSDLAEGGPFTLDETVPDLPLYTGVEDGGYYKSPISLRFHTTGREKIHYTKVSGISSPDEPVKIPEDPDRNSKTFEGEMRFEGEEGENVYYFLKFLPVNIQSGTTGVVHTLQFFINRKIPPVPVLAGIQNHRVVNSTVEISDIKNPETEEYTLWVCILKGDGEIPEKTDREYFEKEGIIVSGPLTFDTDPGTKKRITLLGIYEDKAGNVSESPAWLSFTIDKTYPPLPEVSGLPDGGISRGDEVVLSFEPPEGFTYLKFLHEISDSGTRPVRPGPESEVYEGPLTFQPPERGKKEYFVRIRSMDELGNFSESDRTIVFTVFASQEPKGVKALITEFPVFPETKQPHIASILEGAVHGGRYRGEVILTQSDRDAHFQDAIIRYETGRSEAKTDSVTSQSRILDKELRFDAAEGEIRNYVVRFRTYTGSDGNIPAGSEELLVFSIDKAPLSPPSLSGIAEEDHFREPVEIALLAESGTIYYALNTLDDTIHDFLPFQEQFEFDGKPGSYQEYVIQYYAEDEIGNRSRVQKVSFTMDPGTIYLSSYGDDENSGSRDAPVASIHKALELSEKLQSVSIMIGSGEYFIEKGHFIENEILMKGGMNSLWKDDARSVTVLTHHPSSSQRNPLLEITKGRVRLENITLYNVTSTYPLVKAAGGSFYAYRSSFIHGNSKAPTAFESDNAEIVLEESTLRFTGVENGTILSAVNGGRIVLRSSRIEGTGSSGGLSFVKMSQSTFEAENSTLSGGTSRRMEAFQGIGSSFFFRNTQVDIGTASVQGGFAGLRGGSIDIGNSVFEGNRNGWMNTGFHFDRTGARIDSAKIHAGGRRGIALFNGKESSLRFDNLLLETDDTDEFIFLFRLTDTQLELYNTEMIPGKTMEFTAFDITGGGGVVSGNQLFMKEDTVRKLIYKGSGAEKIDFSENIF